MTDDIRRLVIDAVLGVAPEVDADAIATDADMQDELDLDSMDMLNIITALSEQFEIDIPERDYGRLRTVDGAVAYLIERTGALVQ
jgi:acyl carrier protein